MKTPFVLLPAVIAHAKKMESDIKAKFPLFRGYLVFSSRFGQSNLGSGEALFKDYPAIVEPCPEAIEIINAVNSKKKIEIDFHKLVKSVEIRDDVFVEVRFDQINYELVQAIKDSDLINKKYTEPGSFSIRIVLFRINDLVDLWHSKKVNS